MGNLLARRGFVACALVVLAGCGSAAAPSAPAAVAPSPSPTPFTGQPNIVVILADDMGYGDLGCFGSVRNRTPEFDRLAREGARLTDFHVPSALCTPSRGAFMTGLYPPRTGLVGNLPSGSPTGGISDGIDDDEITLAGAVRDRGYATHMVGKWHLGSTLPHLPTLHGFDSYFGISNGDQTWLLLRDTTLVRDPPALDQLNRVYTQEAVQIVRTAREPFFLYFAHRDPHEPWEPGPQFRGRSAGGVYSDVIEEMDWSTGEVMGALRERGIDRRTLVVFFSDNGPPRSAFEQGASAGPFRGGKNTPFEGGQRVPALAWWPGRIPGGREIAEPLISIDLFPTIVGLAGGTLSPQRRYYGVDLMPLLSGTVSRLPGPGIDGSRELLGYQSGAAVSIRSGRWKLIGPGFWDPFTGLYDFVADQTESMDFYGSRPDVAQALSGRLYALADEISWRAKRPKHGGEAE